MHRDKEHFVGKQALEGTNRTELLLSGVKVQDYAPERDNRHRSNNRGSKSLFTSSGHCICEVAEIAWLWMQVFIGTSSKQDKCEVKTSFLDPDRGLVGQKYDGEARQVFVEFGDNAQCVYRPSSFSPPHAVEFLRWIDSVRP